MTHIKYEEVTLQDRSGVDPGLQARVWGTIQDALRDAFDKQSRQALSPPGIIAPRDVEEKAFSTISNSMYGGTMFAHGNSVYILQEPDGDYEIVYRVVDGVVSVEARMVEH